MSWSFFAGFSLKSASFFWKIFKCKDKALRKYLHSIIIADIKQLNKDSKNHGINKKLQNFILGLMQDPNEDASNSSPDISSSPSSPILTSDSSSLELRKPLRSTYLTAARNFMILIFFRSLSVRRRSVITSSPSLRYSIPSMFL